MDLIGEFFIEIIFRRILVGFIGYYTLFFAFKLLNHKKGLTWLYQASAHEGEEFGKGCIISVVGLISFALIVSLIVYIFY